MLFIRGLLDRKRVVDSERVVKIHEVERKTSAVNRKCRHKISETIAAKISKECLCHAKNTISESYTHYDWYYYIHTQHSLTRMDCECVDSFKLVTEIDRRVLTSFFIAFPFAQYPFKFTSSKIKHANKPLLRSSQESTKIYFGKLFCQRYKFVSNGYCTTQLINAVYEH